MTVRREEEEKGKQADENGASWSIIVLIHTRIPRELTIARVGISAKVID